MVRIIIISLFLGLFVFQAQSYGNPLPEISRLQKYRLHVCESVRDENIKKLRKNLKLTRKFLEKEARKSDSPEKMSLFFGPSYEKIEKVLKVEAYDRVSDVLIYQVYRDALIGLREKYRDQIRKERMKPYQTYVDFFINDCSALV